MKELKNALENGGFNLSKVVRQIVIAVIVLILFAVLFATGQIIFLIQIFAWIETKVRAFTGLDTLLAKGLAALIMGGLLALPLWTFFFSFLPIPQKNKKEKRFAVMAIFALMFIASFFASQRVYFNPDSGKPMKYYSIAPDGEYKFYSSDGYDPVTGDKLQPVTKEIAVKHASKKKAPKEKSTRAQRWYEEWLMENKKLSEEEKAVIEKEKAVLEEKKVSEAIANRTAIKLDIKYPVGVEQTADFYGVRVINDLNEKVFFYISAKIESESEIKVFSIPSQTSLSISICEGRHYFGFIDVNGDCVVRNTLSEFSSYGSTMYFEINSKQYNCNYNRIISIPQKKEILLSDI